MDNDNETVEQVALSDRPLAEQIRILRGNYCIGSGEFNALDEAADVVECHQREIADFQRRYDVCVRRFNEANLERVRLRDEVAEKDAKIEWYSNEVKRLNACLVGGEGKIDGEIKDLRETVNTEIASLRALVKELADALDGFTCKGDCEKYCVIDEHTKDKEECVHIDNRALVAKAREVVSKMETTTEVCK